ncbi:MAG: adenosylcobinamide-GDP ribazoletransferase [Candidatus Omnitrophota bacterium]
MKHLLSAIRFLTILPIGRKYSSETSLAAALTYFPLIGLIIGTLLAGLNVFLSAFGFSPLVSSLILVVAQMVITGGMHLDGLSDTFDALLSGKAKDESLEIMRDPRIGVMGVLSLISVILLKIGLLYELSGWAKINALILMCVLSRWAAVGQIFIFPYARNEGKAKVFFQNRRAMTAATATVFAMAVAAVVAGGLGIAALSVVAAGNYLWGKVVCRKLSGITGDTLGATIELTELITLAIILIGGKIYG